MTLRLRSGQSDACALCVCVHSERLLKLQLEDLREFLQEQLAVSFFLPDDVVVEQLQVAMSELRSKKLDQPPPGGDAVVLTPHPPQKQWPVWSNSSSDKM